MRYSDREGNIEVQDNGQDKLLKLMYTTLPGRAVTSLLVSPTVSRLGGKLLSTKLSASIVPFFIKANSIDMSLYEQVSGFTSFNDFFTRKIKSNMRPIDDEASHLVSPCDSKLSVYKIADDARFNVKNTPYTVEQLLRDKKLARKYEGGYIFVFRLAVDDYHRYHYIDDGIQSKHRYIEGVFNTVNPVANDVYPIYKENTRSYSILRSQNFGDVLMMEVGALLVGKIVNNHKSVCRVNRGDEKGYFEYGGSTVILLFAKDTVVPDQDILNNTVDECETRVKMGMKIGVKCE